MMEWPKRSVHPIENIILSPPRIRESTAAPVESNSMGGQDSDERLVELASQGSGDAFDQLVSRYQDRIYNLLLRMCGSENDAEELCQESFIRAWKALGSFRQGSRFFTWVYRIA